MRYLSLETSSSGLKNTWFILLVFCVWLDVSVIFVVLLSFVLVIVVVTAVDAPHVFQLVPGGGLACVVGVIVCTKSVTPFIGDCPCLFRSIFALPGSSVTDVAAGVWKVDSRGELW